MLTIRREQMQAFESAALGRFEDELVDHSKEFAPRLCSILGDDQVRAVVRHATARANAYGFSFRGPIRLCVEMTFLFGSGFDSDPQYPKFREILIDTADQMRRAERLRGRVIDYQELVCGPVNSYVRQALDSLSFFARMPPTLSESDFVPDLLGQMNAIYPQKSEYVGKGGLLDLIHRGRTAAINLGFATPRSHAMVAVLKFAFGHACLDDPLYPWISRTLHDQKITDPPARAARLEKKALTWLDHVLADPDEPNAS